jgi:hypothetical protein
MVIFTHRSLNLRVNNCYAHWIPGGTGPRAGLDAVEERNSFDSLGNRSPVPLEYSPVARSVDWPIRFSNKDTWNDMNILYLFIYLLFLLEFVVHSVLKVKTKN